MENVNRKSHWENIYTTKSLTDVSWYQPNPETSLQFFKDLTIAKDASIIDIGGGDSFLVDHLLELGFTDLTVLDISGTALERAQKRLGENAVKVKWIVADILDFEPEAKYDFWHDRAAFHFLTTNEDVNTYLQIAQKAINPDGHLVIGTFSKEGPLKCSGIEIKQYSEADLTELFSPFFDKMEGFSVDHTTPFSTVQNFQFCSFKRKILS